MDAVGRELFVGQLADAADATAIAAHGIETIVSLTHEEPDAGFPTGSRVQRHPMTDGPQNERAAFEAAVAAVREALAAEQPLLVHCRSGASRSPAVAATALALERTLDLDAAFQQVAARREAVDPHPALVRQAAQVYTDTRR